jgi:hypothetical protein
MNDGPILAETSIADDKCLTTSARIGRGFFSAILLVAMAVALLEITLRLTGTGFIWAREAPIFKMSDDPRLEIEHQAGFSGKAFGGELHLNRLGLRELWDVPPPNRKRVLAVGDSLLFGFGSGDGQTIADHLERYLAGQNCSAEVMNAGVSGYKPSNEVAMIEKMTPLLDPDLVLVLMIPNDWDSDVLITDHWGRLAQPGQFPDPNRSVGAFQRVKRWFAGNSHAYNFLSAIWWKKVRPSIFRTRQPSQADTYSPVQWAMWETSVRRLARIQSDSGIPMLVALYSRNMNPEQRRRAVGFMKTAGVACYDFDPLEGVTPQDAGGAKALQPYYYTWWDGHPTNAGYRHIAYMISTGGFAGRRLAEHMR